MQPDSYELHLTCMQQRPGYVPLHGGCALPEHEWYVLIWLCQQQHVSIVYWLLLLLFIASVKTCSEKRHPQKL